MLRRPLIMKRRGWKGFARDSGVGSTNGFFELTLFINSEVRSIPWVFYSREFSILNLKDTKGKVNVKDTDLKSFCCGTVLLG